MTTISGSSVVQFLNDDKGYVSWLAAHQDGYVVNCHAQPDSTYLMLHRANCSWINPPRFKNWTTVGYMKVCGLSVSELAAWAVSTTGGTLQQCKSCVGFAARDVQPPNDLDPASSADASIPAPGVDEMGTLVLKSGLRVVNPLDRLLRFCREEFDYYDGVTDLEPDHVRPVDVMVTIAMNSFIDKASQVRRIHRGLATACNEILAAIPANADLLVFDPDLDTFHRLLHAAVQVPEVLVPRAVKVLHRKRRGYVPMLDTVVLNYYLDSLGRSHLKERSQDKASAAAVGVEVLRAFRDDLREAISTIRRLETELALAGFALTPVRILEILVWTETEPNGHYRQGLRRR